MTRPARVLPRSRQLPVDPLEEAPRLAWPELYAYLRRSFEQGDHVSILGPTGTGKTHLAFELAEIRSYVLAIATKPRDPLVDDALKRGYYLVSSEELRKGVDHVDGRPLHPKMIYWPKLSESTLRRLPESGRIRARTAYQKQLIQGAIGYVDRNGHWCVLIDEGIWVYKDLRLANDVDAALTQWRTNKASVILLAQRPAWIGRAALSMPKHIFIFHTGNVEDMKSLGDITGANTRSVREIIGRLDRPSHEFLYINAETGEMFRSVAPPR